MKHWRRVLAIIVGLGLALAWPAVPVAAADSTTVTIDAPAEAIAGSDFIARVAVDDVQDFDACGFDVVYDHTVVTVTDVTGGEIAGHAVQVGAGFWSYIPVGTEDTGRIRVIAFRPGMPEPGVTGAGHVAQIHFEVIGPAGETSEVRLESVGFYDWQGDPISSAAEEDHTVLVSAATEPTIAFSPRSFSFSAAEGGADPTGGTLEIWNSGPGTVDWSVSGDAQWLSLSPSSGTSAGERNSVTVSVDIAGMSAGDYSAIMTIAAPGAANSPRTVNVSLEIGADSGTPVDDNDRPPARPPLFVLWIALGAVAIAVVIVLVLKRHTA